MRSFSDIPGADAGQLVDVADEQEVGAHRHGLQEAAARRLSSIEDSSTMRKSVASGLDSLCTKPPRAVVEGEQAVNGRGEAAGGFGEALRGAAGGRSECHADFLRLQDIDERAEDGGFPGAGAAGENRELVRQGIGDGGRLQRVKFEAGLVLRPLDRRHRS